MVLGLLLGSAVQALIPPQWVARALGRSDFGSVVNGGLMSLPGMMCTCCAAPVVAGLRARQAAPGAAIAFWLGNTVLNPATLVFMGFVLGWQWTGLRLGLGVLMVFGLGYLVNRMVTPKEAEASRDALKQMIDEEDPGTAFTRWLRILGRMTVRLVPEYIVLVLLLGAARAWLFPHIGPDIDNSVLWIVAFAVAGMLFVIPTAGEVPIIQAMLSLGMAAGPAGALLMTLAADQRAVAGDVGAVVSEAGFGAGFGGGRWVWHRGGGDCDAVLSAANGVIPPHPSSASDPGPRLNEQPERHGEQHRPADPGEPQRQKPTHSREPLAPSDSDVRHGAPCLGRPNIPASCTRR